ncbi:MAG: hypothetical protein AAFQ54_14235 [Pseudomonadota bacterium]
MIRGLVKMKHSDRYRAPLLAALLLVGLGLPKLASAAAMSCAF